MFTFVKITLLRIWSRFANVLLTFRSIVFVTLRRVLEKVKGCCGKVMFSEVSVCQRGWISLALCPFWGWVCFGGGGGKSVGVGLSTMMLLDVRSPNLHTITNDKNKKAQVELLCDDDNILFVFNNSFLCLFFSSVFLIRPLNT